METPVAIPSALIREVINGKPYYYKGYRRVLAGQQTSESIMGSSHLQAYLNGLLMRRLAQLLPENEYMIQSGEPGLHIGLNDNVANDITIRRVKDAFVARSSVIYDDTPPAVVIEIDVQIDTEDQSDLDYVLEKTAKLLQFGVERVLWVLTGSRKLVVATAQHPALSPLEWHETVALLDTYEMNLEQWIQQGVYKI